MPALGQALYLLGRLDDAYRTFDAASERADPDTAARAYFMKTAVRGHGESISPYEIERDMRAGLARVEGAASDGTLAAGYNLLGWALYWSGRLEAATEQAQRAMELARSAGDRPLELAAIRLDAARVLHGDVPGPRPRRRRSSWRRRASTPECCKASRPACRAEWRRRGGSRTTIGGTSVSTAA